MKEGWHSHQVRSARLLQSLRCPGVECDFGICFFGQAGSTGSATHAALAAFGCAGAPESACRLRGLCFCAPQYAAQRAACPYPEASGYNLEL